MRRELENNLRCFCGTVTYDRIKVTVGELDLIFSN